MMFTASPTLSASASPASNGEMPIVEVGRQEEIEKRHRAVVTLLAERRLDALLIRLPHNFSWLTCGGDNTRGAIPDAAGGLFLTRDARLVVANSVDSSYLFDQELPGLGFQLKQRDWHEPLTALEKDLCRGRNVASDTGFDGTENLEPLLAGLRLPLVPLEVQRLRETGRLVAHAVEATGRNFRREQTEAEIAAELSHRLLKHHVEPVRMHVFSDGRCSRSRSAGFGSRTVTRYCTLVAIGRRHGLHVAAARTISFGSPPADLVDAHQKASLVLATGIFFSQNGWQVLDTWKRIQRMYEKLDCPAAWERATQGEILGYNRCEHLIAPRSELMLKAGMPISWHPSVGTATVGDSILIHPDGVEVLTPSHQWPKLLIEVKGTPIECPDILVRPFDHSPPSTSTFANATDDSVLNMDFYHSEFNSHTSESALD